VLYLGRPCQYTEGADRRGCSEADWTGGRFSARLVEALDRAVDLVKARTGAASVALHGFSGGGAMAALLAARRQDAVFLATVAGNLDHRVWTGRNGDTPLHDSLNPADFAAGARRVPQLHVLGGQDLVIPPALLDSWLRQSPGAQAWRIVLPEADHAGPWAPAWPELLRTYRKY
jgi:dienelactone hydrolase